LNSNSLKNIIKNDLGRERNDRLTSKSRSNESLKSLLKKDSFDDNTRSPSRHSSKSRKTSNSALLFESKYPPLSKYAPSNRDDEEPKNFKRWAKKSIKGGFYFNHKLDGIVSNSYALEMHSNSPVYFTIETYKTPLHSSI
jgi:hypothetical protein